jgi:hypothetical protein
MWKNKMHGIAMLDCSFSKWRRSQRMRLVVPPVSELQYKGTVTNKKGVGIIIICVHKKQVGGRAITPLQPRIEIDVLLLIVVLNERC